MSEQLDRVLALHAALNEQPLRVRHPAAGTTGHAVELPPPDLSLEIPLTDALWNRRSRYAFDDRPLSLRSLSTLLRLAVGVGRRVPAYGQNDYPLGLAPSAGGLHSLTTYVVARRIEAAEPGGYFYEPRQHTLHPVAAGDPTARLVDTYVQTEFADRAPATLVLVAQLDVALAKYPLRHYRTMHVDAGVAAQNLYLVSEALSLSACAVAGFYEAPLADLLCLSEPSVPVLLFPVGHRPVSSGELSGDGGRRTG